MLIAYLRHLTTLIAVLAVLLSSPNSIADDKIYRVKDKAGNIIFTDKPPAQTTEDNVAEVVLEEDSNIADSEKTVQENHPEWLKDAQEKREKEQQEKSASYYAALESWQERLKYAQDRVYSAENQLIDAKVVKEGDFIGFAKQSGARPSYQYLKRVEDLTAALVSAQKNLEAIKRQKPRQPH